MSWLFPARAREATSEQLAATGAGGFGYDPVDGDVGYRRVGESRRDVPRWTLDKARAFSVAAYRANPMARAVLDTYTGFAVGDSGLVLQGSHPATLEVARKFWTDPRNALADQALFLRSHMLMGESLLEMLVGPATGVTRRSVIAVDRIQSVELEHGNPLWPSAVRITVPGGDPVEVPVVQVDDLTGLRSGAAIYWRSWRALEEDRRGFPFLGPILDWLDSYDKVLSNLVDRTALARYAVHDVTITGNQDDVDAFIARRGGTHAPKAGAMEVHNDKVKWELMTGDVGAREDTTTAAALLTNVAAGTGLAKTWLADPEDSNRATSLTMAEPVRRRVGGLQNLWLSYQLELVRFAVDQAVAAGRLDAEVEIPGEDGKTVRVAPAETITLTGPEVAASDAQISAQVLVELSTAVAGLRATGHLSEAAATLAVRKGWEDFMGVPYRPELDDPAANRDDVAQAIDEAAGAGGALELLGG